MTSDFPGYFLAMISFALMKFPRGMFPSFILSKLFLRRISSIETYFCPVLSAIRFAIVVFPTPKGPRTIMQHVILNAPETAAFRRHVLEAHSGSHVQNKPTPSGVGISEHVIFIF